MTSDAVCKTPPVGREIKGKVVNEEGKIIAGASIKVKDPNLATVTDRDGNFSIKIGEDKKSIILVVAYLGYEIVERSVDLQNEPVNIVLKPVEFSSETMGVILIVKQPKKVDIPLLKESSNDTVPSAFTVFPNPVKGGGQLNLKLGQKFEEGYYITEIINQSGRSFYKQEIWIFKK